MCLVSMESFLICILYNACYRSTIKDCLTIWDNLMEDLSILYLFSFLFQQMKSLAVSTSIGFLGEIAPKNLEKNTIVC